MAEPAETKAYLKTAMSALREAWPCDHVTHYDAPYRVDECPGAAVERALVHARSALKRLAREKEAKRRE